MKKLILFIIVGLVGLFGHVRPARAGTNAFLPFNTNTYQVPVANWWTSNAVAIESALNGIGFTHKRKLILRRFVKQDAAAPAASTLKHD